MGKKLRITQIRSIIGAKEPHKRTMKALGLGKMHRSVVKPKNPQILGMVAKVKHLVKVEEIEE